MKSNKKSLIIIISIAMIALIGFGVIKTIQNKNHSKNDLNNSELNAESTNGDDITILQATLKDPDNKTEVSTDEFGFEYVIKKDGLYSKLGGTNLVKIAEKRMIPLTGKWEMDEDFYYEFHPDQTFTITIPYEYEGKTCYTYYNGTYEIVTFTYDLQEHYNNAGAGTKEQLLGLMGVPLQTFLNENLCFIRMYYDNITNSEDDTIFYEDGKTSADIPDSTFEGFVCTTYEEGADLYKICLKPNSIFPSFAGYREVN